MNEPPNLTLEGKHRTIGGESSGAGQKLPQKIGHHLWTFPYSVLVRIAIQRVG